MKLRLVIIDEPIHIENEIACKLWQKTLWAKEKGYRKHYKTSMMPIDADDFFGAHYIVAEEKKDGSFEPIAMTKAVKRSQSRRFNVPFGAESMLKTVGLENEPAVKEILSSEQEIAYQSSWTINPDFQKDRELTLELRKYITLYICYYFKSAGIPRWVSAGVTRYKIDRYLEYLGGKEVLPAFPLPIIDYQTVRLFYFQDAYNPPAEPLSVAQSLKTAWDNRIEFHPSNNKGELHVVRAA